VVLSKLSRPTTLSLSSVPESTMACLLHLGLLLNSLCLDCACCFFKLIHLKSEEETDGSVSVNSVWCIWDQLPTTHQIKIPFSMNKTRQQN